MVHETPHGNLYPLRSPLMGAAKSGGGTGTRLLTPYPCPAAPGAAQPVCRTHPALQDQRAFFSTTSESSYPLRPRGGERRIKRHRKKGRSRGVSRVRAAGRRRGPGTPAPASEGPPGARNQELVAMGRGGEWRASRGLGSPGAWPGPEAGRQGRGRDTCSERRGLRSPSRRPPARPPPRSQL